MLVGAILNRKEVDFHGKKESCKKDEEDEEDQEGNQEEEAIVFPFDTNTEQHSPMPIGECFFVRSQQ